MKSSFHPQIAQMSQISLPELEGVDAEFHNLLHMRCLAMAAGTATLAAVIGLELLAIKRELKDKRVWSKWIVEHCRFSKTTCYRYMEGAVIALERGAKNKMSQHWDISKNGLPDIQPSKLDEADSKRLERLLFETIGGVSLNMLLHSSDEPQNLAEIMACEAATATLPTVNKEQKAPPKVAPKIGSIADFRAAWDAAPPATRTRVLAVIDDEPLAAALIARGHRVTLNRKNK